jgi:hypothetical protein
LPEAEEAARIDQRIARYLADLDATDATENRINAAVARRRKGHRSPRVARSLKQTALLAKPMNGINAPKRPDCVAGQIGLEVRRETGKE